MNSPSPIQRQPIVDGAEGRDFPARGEGQDCVEGSAERDGEFYIDGADCVIRVDNTLFRVSVILRASVLLSFRLLASSRRVRAWHRTALQPMSLD